MLTMKMALVLALAAATSIGPADFPLQRLLKDPEAARTFDYWRLRGDQGPEAVAPFRAQANTAIGLKGGELSATCPTDAGIEVLAGLTGVKSAASSRQWHEDRVAAAVAVRRLDQAMAALMAGGSSGEPGLDAAIRPFLQRARTEKTARGRDLAMRVAKDQAMRRAFENEALLGPLSPSARDLASWPLWSRICRTDADNVAWIKHEVRTRGWFEISRYGREAEKDAWLLVQHADDDIAFQTEILAVLDKLRTKGETNPRSYAYLYDRVATNAGRPQRYGTQGGCRDGQRFTQPLEDPAKVDQLRAQVGMNTLAEYNAQFTCKP